MQITRAYIIRSAGDSSPAYCHKCGQDKPIEQYYKHSIRSDGAFRYRPYCKGCRTVGGRKHWSRPVHKSIVSSGSQNCKFCGKEKPLEDFYSNGCFADGVKKYRTRCKICVLKKLRDDQPSIYKTKAHKRSASPKAFISSILNHAAKRKQELGFDIDLGYLVRLFEEQLGKCAVSGVGMTYLAGSGRIFTNISLDRIDSSKGYLRGNVQFVCDIVNRMKSDMEQKELLFWCRRILGNADEVQNSSLV